MAHWEFHRIPTTQRCLHQHRSPMLLVVILSLLLLEDPSPLLTQSLPLTQSWPASLSVLERTVPEESPQSPRAPTGRVLPELVGEEPAHSVSLPWDKPQASWTIPQLSQHKLSQRWNPAKHSVVSTHLKLPQTGLCVRPVLTMSTGPGICTNTALEVFAVSALPATPSLPRAFTLISLDPGGSFTMTSAILQVTSGGSRCSNVAGFSQEATPVTFACSRWSK